MIKNETQLVCLAVFIAKEGEEKELIKDLHSLISLTHQEGGCIRYELNQSIENPKKIVFIEKWYDEDTFNKHCNTQYIKDFFKNGNPEHVETFNVELYKEILK